MAVELVGIKRGGAVWPVDNVDKESFRNLKQGQAVKISLVRQSARSIDHHRLYWGGLVRLIADYWEPSAGAITPNEVGVVNAFSRFLSSGMNEDAGDAIEVAKEAFMVRLRETRAAQIDTGETSLQDIHDWIKGELQMYDLFQTPSGFQKRLKSINFNAMSQEEFNVFYKKAFDVAWRFVLSRKFENESDAESAVAQLMEMG